MNATLHRDGGGAWLTWQDRRAACAIGRGGIRVHKEEGDGATPAGTLNLLRVLYRADRLGVPRTTLRKVPIGPDDGWCDDPASSDYNRPIRLPHEARHERLWRDDAVYDVLVVLDWNLAPIVRGLGSAIFLHIAARDLAPTEGCVAVSLPDLAQLLSDGVTGISVSG